MILIYKVSNWLFCKIMHHGCFEQRLRKMAKFRRFLLQFLKGQKSVASLSLKTELHGETFFFQSFKRLR